MRLWCATKSNPLNLAASIRAEVQAIDKDQPINKLTTMSSGVSASNRHTPLLHAVTGAFASLAFILPSVGIYGVVSYSVAQERGRSEFAWVWGQKQRDDCDSWLAEGLCATMLGSCFWVSGSLCATRVLTSLLFEVKPTDPVTFIGLSLARGGGAAGMYHPGASRNEGRSAGGAAM